MYERILAKFVVVMLEECAAEIRKLHSGATSDIYPKASSFRYISMGTGREETK